jgi:hypothetical protein
MTTFEKTILHALVKHMRDHGFVPVRMDDPEIDAMGEDTRVTSAAEIVAYLERIDTYQARIMFARSGSQEPVSWLTIIEGNGEDLLSDWGVSDNPSWNVALDTFDVDDAVMALLPS